MRPRYRWAGLSNLTPWSENAPRPGRISSPRPTWSSGWRWRPRRARRPCPPPTPRRCSGATAPTPSFAPRPALHFGDRTWTHAEMYAEATRYAALFRERLDPERPPHVGVLLDNTPDYVFCLAGAGLVGAARGGPQPHPTGRAPPGRHRATPTSSCSSPSPATRTCWRRWRVTWPLPGGLLVSERFADGGRPRRAPWASPSTPPWSRGRRAPAIPGLEPDVESLWVLLFTSGTSAAPKAVRCTQRRLLTTGNRMTMVLDVGPDDVGYLAMPLFHSNSLMVGLAPALVAGASVGLARRFSASRFLDDVRRYGATWFNYTGQAARLPAGHARAARRRRQPAAAGVRQRGFPAGGGGGGQALRRRRGRRVRVDRGRDRPRPLRAACPGGRWASCARASRSSIPTATSAERAVFDGDGRLVNAEAVRGRDRQRRGRGPVRGVLPQRRGHGPHHPQRLVLERRPRLRRRRRLGLLRRDAPRTGSGWTARTSPPPPSRPSWPAIPTSCWRRSTACPTWTPATRSWWRWCCATARASTPTASPPGSTPRATSARNGGPATCGCATALPTTPTNKVLVRTLVHQKFRADRVDGRPRARAGPRRGPLPALRGRRGGGAARAPSDESGRAQAWDL